MVIGLVGYAGSGKDTVANMLVERGFTHCSASDLVRDEIQARGLRPSRELQTQVANEVRAARGDTHFISVAYKRAASENPRRGVVISGIYAEAEAQFLLHELDGALLAITSGVGAEPDEGRIRSRADGARDRLSPEELRAAHGRESGGRTSAEANVMRCIELANYRLTNDGTIDELRSAVDRLVAQVTARSGEL